MATEAYLRAAILGCGRIAGAFAEASARPTTHAQALSADPRFRLVAVSDAEVDRAKAFATRWSADGVCAPEELAGADVDLVVVASPDGAHAENLVRLLNGVKPPRLVVMEKPLCVSPQELFDIDCLLTLRQRTTLVVNHPRRFEPRHRAVRDLIAAEDLGPVVGVHWVYYGGWLHNGVHVIDTLRMLLGGEIEAIALRPGCADRVGDPCLEGDFRCATWPQARISIESHPETAFQLFEGEIRMQNGRVRFDDFGSEILVDTVRVNGIGERELKDTRRIGDETTPNAMQVLYDLAAGFLMRGDGELTARAGIAQAAATMRTLFDARARLGV